VSLRSATGLIILLTALMGVISGIYWGMGLDVYARMPSLIWYLAWFWGLTLWVVMDARERGLPMAFDQGLFVYFAWPVYIPVYLVRSRGLAGLAWLVPFVVGYFVVQWVVAFGVWFAMSALRG